MDNDIKPEKEKMDGRGAPPGKRPRFFACAANVPDGEGGTKLIMEAFPVKDQDPTPHKDRPGIFPKELGIEQFRDKYKMDPEVVWDTPIYWVKSSKKASSKTKRPEIDRVNYDKYVISDEPQRDAVWGNWTGFVRSINNNKEKAFFIPVSKVDQEDGKKAIPPGAGVVNVSDLTFVTENEETAVAA